MTRLLLAALDWVEERQKLGLELRCLGGKPRVFETNRHRRARVVLASWGVL